MLLVVGVPQSTGSCEVEDEFEPLLYALASVVAEILVASLFCVASFPLYSGAIGTLAAFFGIYRNGN